MVPVSPEGHQEHLLLPWGRLHFLSASPPQWPRAEHWKETPVWSQGERIGYWPLSDS